MGRYSWVPFTVLWLTVPMGYALSCATLATIATVAIVGHLSR